MLFTYIFIALLSLIAFATPFTNKFGITFVYRLPGPIIILSASLIASNTPGAGLQFDGFKYTLLIFVILSFTISGILSFSSTTYPLSNSAQIFISSDVTGITFPIILNIELLFSIDVISFL